MMLKGETVLQKIWYFLRTYVLTLKRFELFLQLCFIVVIFLETNVYLLLKRDAAEGHHPLLIEEWMKLGAAGIEVLFGAALAWWGRERRQLALASWLAISSASGLLVLAFPFANSNSNISDVDLCGGGTFSSFMNYTNDDNISGRTVMLVFTALLCALTKVSIWSHGLTYLDDHNPSKGTVFYGILITIRLSLGITANSSLQAVSKSEGWWEPHIALCMLTLMFAILFSLFPARLKICAQEDVDIDTGFFASVNRIIRNKALLVQTFAFSCLSAAVFCFVHYDGAYMQALFHVDTMRDDPRTSTIISDIFRSFIIILFVMVFRVKFSGRRSDGVDAGTASRVAGIVAIFVAIFFAIITILRCGIGDIAGIESEGYEEPSCSSDCGCSPEKYGFSPVCLIDTGTTYFSPCNAGCSQSEELNGFLMYYNCSCGSDLQLAFRGACSLSSCLGTFSAYQVLYTVMLALSAACFLMQGMVIIRAVRPADKAIAVGGSISVVALLAFTFGHLLYMMISNLTCAYKNQDACLIHHPTIWSASATSSVLALLASIASLVASRMLRAIPEPTTDL